ncbi:MAG: hypothetical protein H6553_06845 [Chitinophagales bacterium]|nr:hypothetical protein [Chitinophagales bacterium]
MTQNNFYFNLKKEALVFPDNFNGFIILYPQNSEETLENQQKEMIHNLLSNGFKINTNATIILAINNQSKTIQLPKSSKLKIVLFGVDTKFIGLQIDTPLNKIVQFNNMSIIKTHDAKTMLEQAKYKKQFWEVVQAMIN